MDAQPRDAETNQAPEIGQVTPPRWRICRTCGHAWRSRSRGQRFRCARCERVARSAALAAAQAIREGAR